MLLRTSYCKYANSIYSSVQYLSQRVQYFSMRKRNFPESFHRKMYNMKRISLFIFPLLIMLAACDPASQSTATPHPDPAHNSRVSLDWAGSYQGTLPCADCEGIAVVVTLHNDSRYEVRRKYLGKQDTVFNSTGNFEWNDAGGIVHLAGEEPSSFQVGENRIIQLNMDGQKIEGELADKYILHKISPHLEETYWKLIRIGSAPVPANNNREPHLIFHSNNSRVSGTGGCNNLMGGYETTGAGQVRFGQLASTKMACPNMETDALLAEALEKTNRYELISDTLVLKFDTISLAEFEAVYLR